MKPLTDEDIIFLNGDETSARKGVTISKIKTSQGDEIRVAIWNMVAVEGGYLTPKSSGISLKTSEYEQLISKTAEIKSKIQHLSVNTLDEVLSSFNSHEAVHLLKEKIADLEKKAKKSDSSADAGSSLENTSSTKKKRKSDSM
jgi:hypothetical protein